MRLVQVPIPTGKREAVLRALDEEGIDYVVTEETSSRDYTAVVEFPIPGAAVEPVLEDLREAGIERDSYTVILAAETVISERFDELAEKYAKERDESLIASEELRSRAEEMTPTAKTYALLTTVSVVVATAGVLLDSPAVVVGSMVIAPLIGPAMTASVGTVLDEPDMFRKGLTYQVSGLLLAVLTATAFSLLVKNVALIPPGLDVIAVPEVAERIRPDFLSLVIALGAGIGGAVSLRSNVSAALVGVMIAVALVPPLAVVGIGIAWGLPTVVFGSSVLVLVNVLSINMAAIVTLWYSGYRPNQWFRVDDVRARTLQRVAALAIAIALLSVFLGGVTLLSFQEAATENAVQEGVTDTLQGPAFDDLELIGITVTFEPFEQRIMTPRSPGVERVVVDVSRPEGSTHSDAAQRIASGISEQTPNATVEVRFTTIDRTTLGSPEESGEDPPPTDGDESARTNDTEEDESARSNALRTPGDGPGGTGLVDEPAGSRTRPGSHATRRDRIVSARSQSSSKGRSGSYPMASMAA